MLQSHQVWSRLDSKQKNQMLVKINSNWRTSAIVESSLSIVKWGLNSPPQNGQKLGKFFCKIETTCFFSLDCLFCFLLKKIVAQTTRRQIWPIWLCFWPSKCRLLKALNMYCTVTHTLLQIHSKIHGKKFVVWYKVLVHQK